MGDRIKLTFTHGGATSLEFSDALAAIREIVHSKDHSGRLRDPAHPKVHWNLTHLAALEIIPER
jgi:hypothetical protein